jgi:hypothetical protein
MKSVLKKEPEKTCTDCGQVKPFTAYRKQAALKGGLRNQCKECQDSYNRMRQDMLRDKGLNSLGQPYIYEAWKHKKRI